MPRKLYLKTPLRLDTCSIAYSSTSSSSSDAGGHLPPASCGDMGRGQKRSKQPGKAKAKGNGKPTPPRWQKRLTESLDILDSWEDVTESELVTVCTQLPSIVQLRMSMQAAPEPLPCKRIAVAFERLCAHDAVAVRTAAWEAAHESSLIEPSICESLVGRGDLGRVALAQLVTTAPTDARLGAILAFLQLACETSEEAAASVGAAEVQALIHVCAGATVTRPVAAALEVLLVLTDPTAVDVADDASRAASVGARLAASATWQDSMAAILTAPPPAIGSDTSEAVRLAQTRTGATAHVGRALAAALVLNVVAIQPDIAESLACMMAQVAEKAVIMLASLLKQAAASPTEAAASAAGGLAPLPDAALRPALEAVSNLFVHSGDEDADEDSQTCRSPAARARLPVSEVVPMLIAILTKMLQPPSQNGSSGAGAGSSGAATTATGSANKKKWRRDDANPREDDKEEEEEEEEEMVDDGDVSGMIGRVSQCLGAVLTACSTDELAPAAEGAWHAALSASASLAHHDAHTQEMLLEMWTLLAARCTPEGGAPTRVPVSTLEAAGRAASGWTRSVQAAATAGAISLLGQLLQLVRAAGRDGLARDAANALAAELAMELSKWMRQPESGQTAEIGAVVCAAEAAAALAEDGDAAISAGVAPAVEPPAVREALRRLQGQLRAAMATPGVGKGKKRAREEEEEEEGEAREDRVAQALELVEAALEGGA